MRNELYGNGHDGVKWTFLAETAKQFGLNAVLQVAMTTPDSGVKGDLDHDPRTSQLVKKFFEAERAAFTGSEKRLLARIKPLGSLLDLHIDVHEADYVNHEVRRNEFFEEVAAVLNARAAKQRTLVFLDPDSGIAGKRSGRNHVRVEHIEHVWKAMRPGDVLVVYQSYQHSLDAKAALFAAATTLERAEVRDFGGPNVRLAFIYGQKPDD